MLSEKETKKLIEKLLKWERETETRKQKKRKEDPFQILIRTVLSQRTRDENTDKAAGRLFEEYPGLEELAEAERKEIEELVKPAGFYKVKAERIKEISEIILEEFGGEVPENLEELLKLPGVGRKTAGIVMVYGFGKPVSIPVDTHMHRISNRTGLVKTKRPEQTEQKLMKKIPKKYWIPLNHLLVRFGKRVCKPLRPHCYRCPVVEICEYGEKNLES